MLDRLIDEHIQGKQNHEKVLWALANLELFVRIFKREMADRWEPRLAMHATNAAVGYP
jgi:asparagine synthase (glutamine-hydrolysing)